MPEVGYDAQVPTPTVSPEHGRQRTVKRLVAAIEHSRKELRQFREARSRRIAEYVGSKWGGSGAGHPVPVNLIELAKTIYVTQLASENPHVLCVPRRKQLKYIAELAQQNANHLLREIAFAGTMQQIVDDAIFCVGIGKTGITVPELAEAQGWRHDAFQPYFDCVSFDHWVHDTNAWRPEQWSFCGDRYQMPLRVVLESDLFGPYKDKLKPVGRHEREESDSRVSDFERSSGAADDDTFEDMVELWDIWLPRDRIILTLCANPLSDKVLRVVEWEGPECGPYHWLDYFRVPDNSMPAPVSAFWEELHRLFNMTFTKVGDQVLRMKTVNYAQAGAEGDANRVVRAEDGDTILVANPQAVQQKKFDGADGATLAFLLQVKQLFNWVGGNLDLVGGLGPQSETLGQDRLLHQSASLRIQRMQQRTMEFAKDIIEALLWYDWFDPFKSRELSITIPGTDMTHPALLTPDMRRENDFFELNFDIEPYSMQPRSPAERLNALMQILTNVVFPMMPFWQAQGIGINGPELMKKISAYSNLPELHEMLIQIQPVESEAGIKPRQSPVTTRREERIGRPGPTAQGSDTDLIQRLLSQSVGQPGSQ